MPAVQILLNGSDHFIDAKDIAGGYISNYILSILQNPILEPLYTYALIEDAYTAAIEESIDVTMWEVEVLMRHLVLDIKLLYKQYRVEGMTLTNLWLEAPATCIFEYRRLR